MRFLYALMWFAAGFNFGYIVASIMSFARRKDDWTDEDQHEASHVGQVSV